MPNEKSNISVMPTAMPVNPPRRLASTDLAFEYRWVRASPPDDPQQLCFHLVAIPMRRWIEENGEVYFGEKRGEFDQPIEQKGGILVKGRPVKGWKPFKDLWIDLPMIQRAQPQTEDSPTP